MEQSHLIFLQDKYRCRTRVCPLSYFIYLIYCSYLSYLWKKTKKPFSKFGCFISIFYRWWFFYFIGNFFKKSKIILFCSYNIIISLFDQVRLIVKYGKLEIFYFFRLTKNFNLSRRLYSLIKEYLEISWLYIQ